MYTDLFYQEVPSARSLSFVDGNLAMQKVDIEPSDVTLIEALKQLSDFESSHKVVTDPETGLRFELFISNPDAVSDDTADITLELASYSSAAAFPASNSLESTAANLALEATTNNPQARVYVSSPSMGGSDGFSNQDLRQLWRHGEAVPGGVPLEYFQAMARALEDSEIRPNHAIGNSAGGFYLPGILTALPEGTVCQATFLDRAAGSSSFAYTELAYRILHTEMQHMKQYEKMSDDPLCITDEVKEICSEAIGRQELLDSGELTRTTGFGRAVLSKLVELNAYRKGADNHSGPISDLVDTVKSHPDIRLNFYFPERSALVKRGADVGFFVLNLAGFGVAKEKIHALMVDGTHTTKPGRPNYINGVEAYFRNLE